MDYKERKELFNKIIENEFVHISFWEEKEDLKEDETITMFENKIETIMNQLFQNISHKDGMLLDELESAETNFWTSIARYYFRKGVIAGLTDLNFLNIITNGSKFY